MSLIGLEKKFEWVKRIFVLLYSEKKFTLGYVNFIHSVVFNIFAILRLAK